MGTAFLFTAFTPKSSMPARSIYNFKAKALDGSMISLSQFKGKKILIVNTASKCGFTPQYAKLQALHQKMGDKLVIIGFPANNFGAQEPGTNSEISTFCTKNYGVTFQMMEKVSVLPPDQCAIYSWLTHKAENGWCDKVPTWNFCKYLIDEDGKLTNFWESKVDPLGPEIAEALIK
jgi:glutathione peroxidase